MKIYKYFIFVALIFFTMTLLQSCSSSILVDLWKDNSYSESPLKNILVIAIRKDQAQRRIWEDAFVDEFTKYGVKAIASYKLYPNVLPDTNQIIQTVQEKGFDGILVTRLLPYDTQTHYVESYVTTESEFRYNNLRKRYDLYYREIQHPAYTESQIIDRYAIDVWVIRNEERMIWSATSNTLERNTVQKIQADIAGIVITELEQIAFIKFEK